MIDPSDSWVAKWQQIGKLGHHTRSVLPPQKQERRHFDRQIFVLNLGARLMYVQSCVWMVWTKNVMKSLVKSVDRVFSFHR